MIIDFRVKPPIPSWESLFAEGRDVITKLFDLQGVGSTKSETLEQVISELDELEIAHAVVMGRGNLPGSSNEELAAFLRDQKDNRFIGFIGGDVPGGIEKVVETIDRFAATGLFHGVNITPYFIQPEVPLSDPSWEPIYEAALRHDLPLSITLSVAASVQGSNPNYDYSRPSGLIGAAKKYSDLKIILSHGAWPFVSEAVTTAFLCPNVYLSPDVFIGFPGSKLYVEAANFPLSDRILYGSCYPNVPYSFALEHFKNQDWKPGVLRKVLYENAARLLKLR